MLPMARDPVRVVGVRTVAADVDGQAKNFSKQDGDEAGGEWILRLDERDFSPPENADADAQHPPHAVERAECIGRDRLDIFSKSERLEAVALVGICDHHVFVELLRVAEHALHVLRAFAIPEPAREAER